MVNENNFKILQGYLSHLSTPAAILDEDLSIYWSTDDALFDQFIKSLEKPKQPIKSETVLSYVIDGGRTAFFLSPVFKSKKKIGCYTCIARGLNDCISLTRSTSMSEVLLGYIETFRTSINNIVNINQLARESLDEGNLQDPADILRRQTYYANKALATSSNVCYLFSSPLDNRFKKYATDLGDVLDDVCAELEAEISKSGRHVNYSTVGRCSTAAINDKQFVFVIMNAVQNALLFSPAKTNIGISVINCKKECEIQIKHEPSKNPRVTELFDECALSQEVIKKIVNADFKGKCEFLTDDEGLEILRIQIPASPRNDDIFKASAPVYKSERYNTIHIFIDEIIDNEIE